MRNQARIALFLTMLLLVPAPTHLFTVKDRHRGLDRRGQPISPKFPLASVEESPDRGRAGQAQAPLQGEARADQRPQLQAAWVP